MVSRAALRVLGFALLGGLHLGGSCGGGSGSGGDAPVIRVETPDSRCIALPSAFPAGFDFSSTGTALAASFTPGVVVPVDVEPVPPRAVAPGPFTDLRTAIAADACSGFLDPAFDGIAAVAPDLALVTASSCEAVAFVTPANGALRALTVSTPAGFASGDWPFSPPPGTSETRVATPTRACVRPAPGSLDSLGAPIATTCNGAPGYFSSFTSGAAVAAGSLFVSTSNLGANPGRPDTQYLPGSVLVFDLAGGGVTPVAVLATTGFNPTHVTAYRAPSGREFVLVTVTGALGLRPTIPGRRRSGKRAAPRSRPRRST